MSMRLFLAVVTLIGLISGAQPAHAGDLAYDASEALVVIGHAADGYSTQRCLGAGRCAELNPFLARFDQPVAFAVSKTALAAGQLYLTRRLRDSGHHRLALILNLSIGSSFLALGIRNQSLSERLPR